MNTACIPLARSSDPSTSHGAADQARELAAAHHRAILSCLRRHGPLGKDGIGAKTRLTGVQVCRRMDEMKALGLVVLTGKTVRSASDRPEREWKAAD